MQIQLDKGKICKNPSNDFASNSLWGKLAHETIRSETLFVSDYNDLLKLFIDTAITVFDIYFTYKRSCVKTTPTDEKEIKSYCTNYAIASFVTCYDCLELGELLDSLGTRVLYYDTDSCIFTGNPSQGDYMPLLGKKLGDLTDEITDQW